MDEREAEALYDRSQEDARQELEWCPICLLDTYWCECTDEDFEAYERDIHPMRDE